MNTQDWDLLRSVSRSFYISIRLLPRSLRETVALAYLLARSSDTIADTVAIDVDLRIAMLQQFAQAIQQSTSATAEEMRCRFVPLQQHEAERELITKTDGLLRNLEGLRAEDRKDVRALLATIMRGQLLDLTRWRNGLRALATVDELREYTYLVAGCVGEFWTSIGFRNINGFADRSESQMLDLGRRYGSGLQLVNILRDAGSDLRAGRCYFSATELASAGLTPSDVLLEPSKFWPIYGKWIDEARTGLESGVEYSAAIRNARVRAATCLPALIGARTLHLIQERGVHSLSEKVKVPRSEVRAIIASVAITLAAPDRVRATFNRLR